MVCNGIVNIKLSPGWVIDVAKPETVLALIVTWPIDISRLFSPVKVAPVNIPPANVAVPSVIDAAVIVSFTYNLEFIDTSPSVINPPLIDKSSATMTV